MTRKPGTSPLRALSPEQLDFVNEYIRLLFVEHTCPACGASPLVEEHGKRCVYCAGCGARLYQK